MKGRGSSNKGPSTDMLGEQARNVEHQRGSAHNSLKQEGMRRISRPRIPPGLFTSMNEPLHCWAVQLMPVTTVFKIFMRHVA